MLAWGIQQHISLSRQSLQSRGTLQGREILRALCPRVIYGCLIAVDGVVKGAEATARLLSIEHQTVQKPWGRPCLKLSLTRQGRRGTEVAFRQLLLREDFLANQSGQCNFTQTANLAYRQSMIVYGYSVYVQYLYCIFTVIVSFNVSYIVRDAFIRM